MKKNKIWLLTFILLISILTVACTAESNNRTQTRLGVDRENLDIRRDNITNRNTADNNSLRNMNKNMDNMIDRDINNFNNTNNDTIGRNNNNSNNNAEKADKIAERIKKLSNIENASVLISGNTAIVGVDIKNNVEGQLTKDLKQRIENIVKKADNDIENVSITADPDLFTRISNMAEDITNGRPISGFAEQFEEILRRIAPTR